MKTLHLTLHRCYFIEILAGRKKQEYRRTTPFWTRRLDGTHTHIDFRNGYSRHLPWMRVELRGVQRGVYLGEEVWVLELGRIIDTMHCECLDLFSTSQPKSLVFSQD